jgi:tRNA1(Val) A37 N6-methylase TrmN6
VLELGCGVGVATLCLAARVPRLHLTGLERQPAYAALARLNARDAGADVTIHTADLADVPAALRAIAFDHVLANPPYFVPASGTAARDPGREAANREQTPLALWIGTARARLKPRGWLTLIQDAARLPECLAELRAGFGAVTVLPLQPRPGRPASRVLIRARKGARAPFRLLPPFLVHEATRHPGDRPDFTAAADAVLREGAALPFD